MKELTYLDKELLGELLKNEICNLRDQNKLLKEFKTDDRGKQIVKTNKKMNDIRSNRCKSIIKKLEIEVKINE